MQPKRNNKILIIIIGLLIIIAPLTIMSIYFNFSDIPSKKEEVKTPKDEEKQEIENNSLYKDGKLYFYDRDNNLLGDYTCKKDPCSYAISEIDDENYALEYLKTKSSNINVLLNTYALINDEDNIILYNIKTKEELQKFKAVKNYNNMLPEDLLFVKNNDDKWAIIKLGDSISQITNYDYEFIGLKDTISSNNLLETNYYIVKKDNLWGIIDNAGDLMSNYLSNEITLYNDILISTKKDNKYYLYDYNGKRVIDENGFNYVSFTDKYINIVDSSSNLYVYDYINSKKIGSNIHLNGPDYKEEFESKLNSENNTIDINADGKDYNFALN